MFALPCGSDKPHARIVSCKPRCGVPFEGDGGLTVSLESEWRFAAQNRLRVDSPNTRRVENRCGARFTGVQMPLGPRERKSAMLAAFAIAAFASPAFAHHSFAMFDKNRNVELLGVVARFEWTNPHSYIVISVTE